MAKSKQVKKGQSNLRVPVAVLSAIAVSTFLTTSVSAQDSSFTRQGAGPMYFSTYEHQHDKNTYMPEDRFKANIDWMAENFKSYGYDMIATDGWIEGATLLNKNGYVVSHNDNWMSRPLNMETGEFENKGLLLNGDFELGNAEGWTIETEAFSGVDANDAYDGQKLYVYHPDPFTARVSQTVEGLENGSYTVEARVKFPNDTDNYTNGTSRAFMKLNGFNGDMENVLRLDEGLTNEYDEPRYGLFTMDADVVDGKLTIAFDIDASGEHSSFQLDDVKLYKSGQKDEESSFQYPAEKYPNGHTWKFWGDYIKQRGMDFGIYYNPLWVSPEVVGNPDQYIVKGTENNPDGPTYVAELIDQGDPDDPTDGDRFNGGQGNARALYWVNVEHPDAEKYIKGYIDFFKEQGADFLRVDFLSWYEDGTDPNIGRVGKAHGREHYETQLKWMSEAAKENEMFLSLVMPHLYNHGELELQYGDMIRINEDSFGGGWDHISARRQTWQEGWSQWANSFQGFTGFSDISGRSSMILDGDFLKLNTFIGDHSEHEKKSTLSLYTMAGSPIAIADQFDTIGDNYEFYQNSELIEFNRRGFAGKPIYYTGDHYSQDGSRDSERWVGQFPDGSWAVALFNRSDETRSYQFDFYKEIGVERGFVRDVWKQKDLGMQSGHAVTLEPHDSVVLKVTPENTEKVFQAETASYSKGIVFSKAEDSHEGFGYLQDVGPNDEQVTYAIDANETGDYMIDLKYFATGETEAFVQVRNEEEGSMIDRESVMLSQADGHWADQTVKIKLNKGTNIVQVGAEQGNFSLDSVSIRKAVPHNGVEKLDLSQWTRGNISNTHLEDDQMVFKGNEAYVSESWHYQAVEKGFYTVSADVDIEGDAEGIWYVRDGEKVHKRTFNPNTKKVTIQNVVSKGDNVLKIGASIDGAEGSTVRLSNVRLEKSDNHNEHFRILKRNKVKLEVEKEEKTEGISLLHLEDVDTPRKIHAADGKYEPVAKESDLWNTPAAYYYDKENRQLWVNVPEDETEKIQIKLE
ncbi:hypothetical protein J0K78_04650 [Halobacillus sp. GSS1]|uniref:hypothetical protein n=1 Tax=Halobacillus sp. GSS1 TaxID=2815919 RepID=UPI001A8E05C9|nr:hypothetical protein [Halobacillus sp. GSS1]MBN9653549.1 hypothetical protein [Halobacillus sp. GSS1]